MAIKFRYLIELGNLVYTQGDFSPEVAIYVFILNFDFCKVFLFLTFKRILVF